VEESFLSAFNVNGVSDVRQSEIHTAEPLMAASRAFEVDLAIEKLKRHKSSGTDRIPAEMFEAGCRKIRSEIHKLIKSTSNKEEFPEE